MIAQVGIAPPPPPPHHFSNGPSLTFLYFSKVMADSSDKGRSKSGNHGDYDNSLMFQQDMY
jgi:hypothetical protein